MIYPRNQTGSTVSIEVDGIILCFSYKILIYVKDRNNGNVYRNIDKYSRSTTKHATTFHNENTDHKDIVREVSGIEISRIARQLVIEATISNYLKDK
jgi:hypothetical protein